MSDYVKQCFDVKLLLHNNCKSRRSSQFTIAL